MPVANGVSDRPAGLVTPYSFLEVSQWFGFVMYWC